MSYTKDQLKKYGGGIKARTTYKTPTMKFNGNTGVLTSFPEGDYKNGTPVQDVELVILRPRRVYASYEKMQNGEALRMFTNEHNTWEDHITIFEVKGKEKIKSVGSGTFEELKAEFPKLRINSNLYCFYNGEVIRLSIKGRSRQALVDKQKELAREGLELFEKKIKLTVTQDAGPAGNIIFALGFEVVGDSDLDEIGPHLEKVGQIMDKIDAEYAEGNQRRQKEAEALTGGVSPDDEEDMIPLDETEQDDGEMKVEDIPF